MAAPATGIFDDRRPYLPLAWRSNRAMVAPGVTATKAF